MTGLIVTLRGVRRCVSAAEWDAVRQIAPVVFGLSDSATPEKSAAAWALDRTIAIVRQLRREISK